MFVNGIHVEEYAKLEYGRLLWRVPTTDGRELRLVRRTEPDRDVALPLARLNLVLPPQATPRITTAKTNGAGVPL